MFKYHSYFITAQEFRSQTPSSHKISELTELEKNLKRSLKRSLERSLVSPKHFTNGETKTQRQEREHDGQYLVLADGTPPDLEGRPRKAWVPGLVYKGTAQVSLFFVILWKMELF